MSLKTRLPQYLSFDGRNPSVRAPAQGGSSSALTGNTLRSTSFTIDDTKEFARAIATDLFRYLDSFGHSVGQHAMTTLDKWFLRFSSKMERDPEFWKRITNRD
uniref:Hikeshi-like C-terminal domain-containing protein n=1 Tax=Rhodosorus marinus TaxID=101924 RepID=A0A7S3EFN1_9RHOD